MVPRTHPWHACIHGDSGGSDKCAATYRPLVPALPDLRNELSRDANSSSSHVSIQTYSSGRPEKSLPP